MLIAEDRCVKATASNVQDRLKEHQIYFSREIPAAEKRRHMIDNSISTLLDHPMAFFEHFNQALSNEVFENYLSKFIHCISLLHLDLRTSNEITRSRIITVEWR